MPCAAVPGRAQDLCGTVIGKLGKATAGNAQLKGQLGDKGVELKGETAKTLALADQELIQATDLKLPSDVYVQTFTGTTDTVDGFNALALKHLSALPETLAQDLLRAEWVMLSGLSGLSGLLLLSTLPALSFAAIAQMQSQLVNVVSHMQQNVDSPANASSQIAQSKLDLSGRTRPLCAWPKLAKHVGTGSIEAAANFSCQ